jgi:hypothetical protein
VTFLEDETTISFSKWQSYPIEELYDEMSDYNTFRRMIESLRHDTAREAVKLYRYRFAGFLEAVKITEDCHVLLADSLTSEGVLLRPVHHERKYRVASPLIDALIRLKVIPRQFPNAPSVPPKEIRPNVLDIPVILTECLKCFDKQLIQSAYSSSYKVSTVLVHGSSGIHVPRESVYDTELMRILCNWLKTCGWSVIGQRHTKTANGKHSYSDIVLEKDRIRIVLELLATGDAAFMKSHIQKPPEYVALHSAVEGWVIHFTCEDPFTPIRPEPSCGVNVIYVSHKEDFENITLHIYSKDTQEEKVLCI